MTNNGFSLVELIVVIAIMAILVGVAVPVYTGYVEQARIACDEEYLANLKSAVQLFATENQLEIGSVVVDDAVAGSQGISLFLADGTSYDGDLSKLYAMIGEYAFKSDATDKTIVMKEDAVVPEQTPTVSDDSSASDNESPEECEHEYGSEPSKYIGNQAVYTCIHCGFEDTDHSGEHIGKT